MAIELFRYQASVNPVYKEYLEYLSFDSSKVKRIEEIPFLPISFFKSRRVLCDGKTPQQVFTSSGTGSGIRSKHYVSDLSIYERSFLNAFHRFYGPVDQYCILALLPSYLEREGSSLVYMADHLITKSSDPDSGFYLDQYGELHDLVLRKIDERIPVILLGVSFALLEFAQKFKLPESNLIVMETGGMKGRYKEMVRSELHMKLCEGLGVSNIHSEYGMTELLSQAYSTGAGLFKTPPWMSVQIRETDDPFNYVKEGRTGGINIVDLANIDSCSFIETQDLGRINSSGAFEVMGRFDNSEIRGCNLMVV